MADVTRFQSLRELIAGVMRLDREGMQSPAGRDNPDCTPWMPFPLFDFIALVAEALPEVHGGDGRFLEVGCGYGTRMRVARDIFGLDVHGFDRVEEYVAAARDSGLSAEVADALSFSGYGGYDLVWFNRTFRDRLTQVRLEAKVWNEVKPGAVVMCANLEGRPPRTWWPVLDDMEVRRGIWQKPMAEEKAVWVG